MRDPPKALWWSIIWALERAQYSVFVCVCVWVLVNIDAIAWKQRQTDNKRQQEMENSVKTESDGDSCHTRSTAQERKKEAKRADLFYLSI